MQKREDGTGEKERDRRCIVSGVPYISMTYHACHRSSGICERHEVSRINRTGTLEVELFINIALGPFLI